MERRFMRDSLHEQNRHKSFMRGLWIVCVLCVALGLSLGQPFAAQSQTSYPVQLTATAFASSTSPSYAASQAEQAARANLIAQAQQAGQSCINMTSSSRYVTVTPIGTYVYEGTATASCTEASPPPPTPTPTPPPGPVQRTATAYYSHSSQYYAASQAEQAARANLIAQAQQFGGTCTNITSWSTFVTATPIGTFVYQGTATGSCTA